LRYFAAALIGLAFVLRAFAAVEPLGIDQGLWASAVRGMARGQLLYQDVWEQRPPGIYFIYLTAFKVLGWKASTIAWLDLIASMATAGVLFVITRRFMGLTPGAVAAALFAVLTMPAWLYGNGGFLERSVCETFIALAVGLGAWGALRFRDSAHLPAAVAVGLCMGAAITLKPNAGLYLPGLVIWMVAYRPAALAPGWRAWIWPLGTMAAATLVIPAATLLWLWRLDVLHDAKVAVVDFNKFYVGQGFTVAGQFLAFGDKVGYRIKFDPLWFAGCVAGLLAVVELIRRRTVSPLAGLAMCWGGASALVIFVNGTRLFNSYFIQVLPPLVLMVTWLFFDWARGSRWRKSTGAMVAVLMLAILVQNGYVARVMTSVRANVDQAIGRSDRLAYLDRDGNYNKPRGYSARANAELAAYVQAHTTPDDRIYLFGINGAEVYFAADRLTAHRFLRVNFFVPTDFPDPAFTLEAVASELVVRLPRYLIFENLHTAAGVGELSKRLPEAPELAALMQHYAREVVIEDFSLYRRVE
jgi:hypothetical protein